MRIKRRPLPEWDRWPLNATRFLLPSVAISGFPGECMKVIFVFWRWRVDFYLFPTGKERP
jgi:hypothetical protein